MYKRDSIYIYVKKIGDRLLTQWQVRILLEISCHACNRLIFFYYLGATFGHGCFVDEKVDFCRDIIYG
jgi:hypothetical protein